MDHIEDCLQQKLTRSAGQGRKDPDCEFRTRGWDTLLEKASFLCVCVYNLGKHLISEMNQADGTTQSSANASGSAILVDVQCTVLERNQGCPKALRRAAGAGWGLGAAHERSRLREPYIDLLLW